MMMWESTKGWGEIPGSLLEEIKVDQLNTKITFNKQQT